MSYPLEQAKQAHPEVVKAPLAVARPCGSARSPESLWTEIQNACERGSGELAVVSGEITGRILVQEGKIAWAHLADPTDNLFESVAPGGGINAETARAVVRECQLTGSTIGETIVAWGLADKAQVRDGIRRWIERKLEAICRLPAPQSLFLPMHRARSGEFLFDLSEVTPSDWQSEGLRVTELPLQSGRAPAESRRGWGQTFAPVIDETFDAMGIVQECRSVQGLVGVALINRDTGGCLGMSGVAMDADVAWSMLQCVDAAEREAPVGETIITTAAHLHFAATLEQRPNVLVYAVVDSTENLAAARYGLRKVLKRDVMVRASHQGAPHDAD